MPALDPKLRAQLDAVCQKARDKAEEAARAALQKHGVGVAKPFDHFTKEERDQRNRLRARGRQAGDARNEKNGTQSIEQLTQELAYESWHRMLFARFLAENQLLMHPDGVAVSLEDCDELAQSEGASNGFILAARYASRMLPQIFRTDDVLLEIDFAPEHRIALEKLLEGLPNETFLADDSLGWVYQFWQSKRKKEVNDSGEKIDSRSLPAVTQLFTEDYMVQFLLHNTIGAWWCARQGINGPAGGASVPVGKAPVEMPYLRWRDDCTPAAGTFEDWPKTLKEFKMLDPCCGSGHFLVAAFNLLVPLRMHDDGLMAGEACDAVLRENLFGLELDPRCTQIAAFALAVAAWKFLGEDGHPLGYRELPSLNIACTGIGPQASEEEWLKLAEQSGKKMTVLSREPILDGLRNLHALFSDAPTLGSLIDPNQLSADLITADYGTLQPYLTAALTAEISDDDSHEQAVAAAGMVKAAELLAGEYTLIATNVPYLKRGSQNSIAQDYGERHFSVAKSNLATVFYLRWLQHAVSCGLVIPQNWLYQPTYEDFRRLLLTESEWLLLARLGPGAFETISGEVVNVCLMIGNSREPSDSHEFLVSEATKESSPQRKAEYIRSRSIVPLAQAAQLKKPGYIVSSSSESQSFLQEYADSFQGVKTGDDERLRRCFWEVREFGGNWAYYQSTVEKVCMFGGLEHVLFVANKGKDIARYQGLAAWGKLGVAVSQMSNLPGAVYLGHAFDSNMSAIVPKRKEYLLPILSYCLSDEYRSAVRVIDDSIKPTNSTLTKVPFDLDFWQVQASEQFPEGIPTPASNDPTQWLFNGCIVGSTCPLQVAVARLLGYIWPEQKETDVDGLADNDGIVCIPAVRTEQAAADRLSEILRAAYGKRWSNSLLHDLLTDAGQKPGATLHDWLSNAFFEQHCSKKLFQNRPFIWHIWDGHRDSFSCLVNYHKLNYKTLDNLAHAYLESWIKKQAGDAKTGKAGAEGRLSAAEALQKKLKLILAGEPPYDIFVRWKPLHEQPIGWNPDLNDGVRMNIRPFVQAGVLRKNPNIKWTKDRGNEPKRDKDNYPWFWKGDEFIVDRVNDIHLTIATKQAARQSK